MKCVIAGFLTTAALFAQGRPVDWPLFAGNAQRTGWEKTDSRISRDNVKDFRLVLKQKLDGPAKGARSLSAPVVIGMLISYRGFKELAFVTGSDNSVFALDADLERVFWKKQLASKASTDSTCSTAVTASLVPPMSFGKRRPPPQTGSTKSPGPPPTPAGSPGVNKKGAVPGMLSAGTFGAPRPVFVLAGDGNVHLLNTSDGDDVAPPMHFLPPSARASSLTFADSFLYTTTSGNCAGAPAGVWGIDLSGAGSDTPPQPVHFALQAGKLPDIGGLALSTDGDTIYTRASDGSVYALAAKTLESTGAYHPTNASELTDSITPLVFASKDRDLIASATNDGKVILFDSNSLTAPVAEASIETSGRIAGGLASFEDADGTRWIYAPVWDGAHGAIVAFRVELRDGKPALTRAWKSEDLSSPEPPVVTSGMLFVLAAGNYSAGTQKTAKGHATLYALDAATGAQLYSTGTQVPVPASLSGVTLANGRVYFTTLDNTLWAFGIYLER